MARAIHRQTFIALRARKTAHRLASDILHARKVAPLAPEQPWDTLEFRSQPLDLSEIHRRRMIRLAAILWLLAALIWAGVSMLAIGR